METGTAHKVYKGNQITIDLDNHRCQRKIDEKWIPLKHSKFIAITKVRMNQSISGGRVAFSNVSYQAFCVYIKTAKLNIMAYRGRRDEVIEEANRIARFLSIPIKDLLPKNEEGEVEDDDHPDYPSEPTMAYAFLIIMLIVLVLGLVLSNLL